MPARPDGDALIAPSPAPPRARSFLPNRIPKDLALDLIERVVVVVLFIVFANRMLARFINLVELQIAHPELIIPAASVNIGAILLVLSEALGVVLIVIRRRSDTLSSQPLDWALSFAAVNAPLLAVTAPASTVVPAQFATALMFAGLIIQTSAKATLWRSFGLVPANRGVRTGGLYRFVRHPMYAGYTLTHIGFVIGFPLLQNALLFVTVLLIEVARMLREERILNRDPVYRAYASRVRYRLVPGVF